LYVLYTKWCKELIDTNVNVLLEEMLNSTFVLCIFNRFQNFRIVLKERNNKGKIKIKREKGEKRGGGREGR